jgi:hypothetical protein
MDSSGAPRLPSRSAPPRRTARAPDQLLTWMLSKTELTRPIAALVNRRSAGIKDLRFGYIVDDDRTNCNPDACLRSHRHNVPLLPTANAVSPCPMAHPTRDRAKSSKTLGAYERSDPLDGQALEVSAQWTCVIRPPSRARRRPLTSRRRAARGPPRSPGIRHSRSRSGRGSSSR